MSSRLSAFLCLILLTTPTLAKDKNKSSFPALILNAQTVAVIINPGSEVPLTNPGENRSAQSDVEQALAKWGRLRVVMDPSTADLVISVRRGRGVSPTIAGGDPNQRPIILQPGEGGGRIGIQTGKPPRTGTGYPEDTTPQPGVEAGSAEDVFEVYRGQDANTLDGPPLWRYIGKNALRPPTVSAVEQFRRAIEEAEKQQNKQPHP
jgi:hypothetical protein